MVVGFSLIMVVVVGLLLDGEPLIETIQYLNLNIKQYYLQWLLKTLITTFAIFKKTCSLSLFVCLFVAVKTVEIFLEI